MAFLMRILATNRSRLYNKNLSQLFSLVNSKDNLFRQISTTKYLFDGWFDIILIFFIEL